MQNTCTMFIPVLVTRVEDIELRAERAEAIVEERATELRLEQWIHEVVEREQRRRWAIEQKLEELSRRAVMLAKRDARKRERQLQQRRIDRKHRLSRHGR